MNAQCVAVKNLSAVVLGEPDGESPIEFVATMSKNLESMGFGFTSQATRQLLGYSQQTLAALYNEVYYTVRELVGADRIYHPMYPNFPKQVMNASEFELWINAVVHYAGFVISDLIGDPTFRVLPEYDIESRPELAEVCKVKRLGIVSHSALPALFTKLAASNTSLSEDNYEIMAWIAEHYEVSLPNVIPNKEVLSKLVSIFGPSHYEDFIPHIKTATDVLRVAVAMSDGDVSLAEPTKFNSFTKAQRRFLLGCLNACVTPMEDMQRWRSRWIRLGERLHPGEYAARYPNAAGDFQVLRNTKVFTFNSLVERCIKDKDLFDILLKTLNSRPGEFARRLDHLLRTQDSPGEVIDCFAGVANKVSTPVLLQAWKHFENRSSSVFRERPFFPKGSVAKVQLGDPLPPLGFGVASRVATGIRNILVSRFSELPPLGNVYLDTKLEGMLVPFSQRSSSKSLRSIVRGSSWDIPDGKNTIRFFIYWKQGDSRVDLDLSASGFNDKWENTGVISFYSLRGDLGCHSGDITSAPEGACEFIDVDITQIGYRYILPSVISYTGQKLSDVPECFAGWMSREGVRSGEIFEPSTVIDRVDITSPTKSVVTVVIDTLLRKVYWVDLPLELSSRTASGATPQLVKVGRAITGLSKPTLWDLFSMHACARATTLNVYSPDGCDTIFGFEDATVTPFDQATIISEYLK